MEQSDFLFAFGLVLIASAFMLSTNTFRTPGERPHINFIRGILGMMVLGGMMLIVSVGNKLTMVIQ